MSLWGLYHDGVTLEWSLNPGTTACVSHYQVSLRDQVKSLFLYNTTASTFTWKGDTCIIKSASVQAISEQKLVGKPAYILVRKQLQGKCYDYDDNNCCYYAFSQLMPAEEKGLLILGFTHLHFVALELDKTHAQIRTHHEHEWKQSNHSR